MVHLWSLHQTRLRLAIRRTQLFGEMMTRLEQAVKLVKKAMMGAGRPWVLAYLKTHPDSVNTSIEILHPGNLVTALGLADAATELLKEQLRGTFMDDDEPPIKEGKDG